MKKFKKGLSKIISFASKNSLSFLLGLTFASGLVYAWNAVWHGTNWIVSGGIIEAQKIAENFEYLKQRIDNISTNTGIECTSMKKGWPDIIKCDDVAGWDAFYYISHISTSNGRVQYHSPPDNWWIQFNNDGSFHSMSKENDPSCYNKSISQLVSEGRGIGVVCGKTVIPRIPVYDQVCFHPNYCASTKNSGFQWDDDWSQVVKIKGDNIGKGKLCYKNGARKRCATIDNGGFKWDDDWSPYITLEGNWGNVCENGKEIHFCHKNGRIKRCATPSNGGFQWDDDWSPYVTFECK